MELELLDAIVQLQGGEGRTEQPHQGFTIAASHRFLHRGHRGNDRAHRGRAMRLLIESRQQCVVVGAQFALVGPVDNAMDDPHRAKQHEGGGGGGGERPMRR